MPEETKNKSKLDETSNEEFQRLLDQDNLVVPAAGDIVRGTILSASKAEVKLDIDGIATGVVRGRELYFEAEEYAKLKPGDQVEATIIEEENENGELELSFRSAGQQKAWSNLLDAFENRKILKVRVNDANKGGLLISYAQIQGFLPVSQLAPENYPRINGGDKSKILDKLKSFVGTDFEVKVMTLDNNDDKLIVSEKEAWQEKQKDIISQYKVGSVVEGKITALTDFGAFLSFGENLEGLIHISELAWQRIDDPADLFKVGDRVKAEIISIEGSKIFLSAKKLMPDPWQDVENKYKVGQNVIGTILKVNPFGLFVELDKEIHGLSHISQLGLKPGGKINESYKIGDKKEFTVVSIEPKDHRLGLAVVLNDKEAAKEKKAVKKDTSDAQAKAGEIVSVEKEEKIKKVEAEKAESSKKSRVKKSAKGALASGEKEKTEEADTGKAKVDKKSAKARGQAGASEGKKSK